jgi:hypothetical protein
VETGWMNCRVLGCCNECGRENLIALGERSSKALVLRSRSRVGSGF